MRLPWLKEAPKREPGTDAGLTRDIGANFLSRTTFSWCTQILKVGFTRPLLQEDLYHLDPARLSSNTGDELERNFYARVPPARRPRHLQPEGWRDAQKGLVKRVDNDGSIGTGTSSRIEEGEAGDFNEKERGMADVDLKEKDGLPLPVTSTPQSTVVPAPKAGGRKWMGLKKKLSPEEKRKKKYPGDEKGGKVFVDGVAYDQSLVWALSKTFFWPFWSSAGFLILATLLQTTAPLVTKKLLAYITESYVYSLATTAEIESGLVPIPSGPGYGVGLAFAIFVMQEAASLFQNQYMQRGMATGFLMRSSLIANISRKSLRLSPASRVKHPNGHLVTLVSSDASFMDWAAFLLHNVWVMPIQVVIGVILLCVTMGYSALVGVAILVINTPIQTLFVRTMFQARQGQLQIVDKRVRLLQEVLNGIRVVKLYAFESFFKGRISDLRQQELSQLQKIALVRAAMSASMSFIPVFAAVMSFITYSLSGHNLDAAIIFSSLQLFNVIRQPLTMLPFALTVSSDALVGLKRICTALLAEELADDMQIDPTADLAIRAHGDFAWESSGPVSGIMGKGYGGMGRGGRDRIGEKKAKKEAASAKKEKRERKKKGLPPLTDAEKKKPKDEEPPFELRAIDVEIPRGSLTCIVGTVGSGKSSLLQAFIGEMKRVLGDVVFGGRVSYAAQSAWVMNATLRDNILFGKESEPKRFEEVIHACALSTDLEILPSGLETEIGEKGINLSGGQKARVSLARAVYFDADVALLDDPLSAVDAHVAKHIMDECLLSGPLAGKTRVLVTHHLDVLPHADHIIMMDHGRIVEQGTYDELIRDGEAFSQLIAEFGSKKIEPEDDEDAVVTGSKKPERQRQDLTMGAGGAKLMQDEERETGSVSWSVYTHYVRAMGSVLLAPLLFFCFAMAQISTVGNNVFLGFWSAQSIVQFQGEGSYMAIYASLGLAAGIFQMASTYVLYICGIRASYNLFNEALAGVMRSKVTWFDTTPMGRIVSRMSKDITTLDNQLPMQWNQLLTMVFSVFGTIGLVFYTFPLLGIIFVPMGILYYAFATFYRASSREIKRLDSLLRSFIYTHYGEMLSGLASVRAYGQQKHFLDHTEDSIDQENRAYFLTISLQRWLGVRLDFLGNILILGIALFGVGFRDTVSPSKLGVVLTYSLSVTQVFSQLVSTFATVEQDMNTAERVSHYSMLDPEGAVKTDNDPPASWPDKGCIEFKDVRMRYREGLPEVLKGVSFATKPGEKVGIVGRTGAGKSSLLQVLFRIIELSAGSIVIDGYDISKIGLDVLRKQMAVIPQDALLYAGTIRENLDPVGEKDDASLNDSLRRAGLIAGPDATEEVKTRMAKFKLDAAVTDEGANFSAGERQLVALCRALVKNSRVIVLDEATSSVDVETDASVQKAIQVEFSSQSLLCIAHRLATIAFYDRVLVMDKGEPVEFDTPLNLYDRTDSIFRSMCEKAHLSREDIVRIRRGAGKSDTLSEVVADHLETFEIAQNEDVMPKEPVGQELVRTDVDGLQSSQEVAEAAVDLQHGTEANEMK